MPSCTNALTVRCQSTLGFELLANCYPLIFKEIYVIYELKWTEFL